MIERSMVVSASGTPRMLVRDPMSGEARVQLLVGDEAYTLPTFQGGKAALPTATMLRTVCRLKKQSAAAKPTDVELLDDAASNLNNFAALCMLWSTEWVEAWDAIFDAEDLFLKILHIHPSATPALLQLAVVRWNASTLARQQGSEADGEGLRESVLATLGTIAKDDRDADYWFVLEAAALRA